jgi:hypothetical protein
MIRIALVAEGVTDFEVIGAAVESMLDDRPFTMTLLQQEESVAFTGGGAAGPLGGGWRGVYRWCLQSRDRRGRLGDEPLFLFYDLLILHLDADVAGEDPARHPHHPIPELNGILPCQGPCPPPRDSTDPLRGIMLSWLNVTASPRDTVLCTPSKSTEAWVMAICFPQDRDMQKQGWECHMDPEARLAQQPKPKRFRKCRNDYNRRKSEFKAGWPNLAVRLTEAGRFDQDFRAATAMIHS